MQVHIPKKKNLVRYKDKCWKIEPSIPTVFFSSCHAVKPNNWSLTRCWAAKGVFVNGLPLFDLQVMFS